MITEKEYIEAIKTIAEYTEQIKTKTEQVLNKTGITKTPRQLHFDWDIHFPTMSCRLWHILRWRLPDKRLCDITKREFRALPGVGVKTCRLFCDITGK